jgi:hypothetical protein
VARLRVSTDAVERAVAESIDSQGGDVYFVPKPWFVVETTLTKGAGTNHGTPWPYDRQVPVIFWGAGVSKTMPATPLSALRIAPTISALLRVPPPSTAREPALPGAPPVRSP